nr:Scr1 family TA system antitoxin-like transcriptional regulator [Streptomyces sp. DSM 41633]
MSEPRSAPTVGQVVLGKRLQDLRERVGLNRDQAAKVLRVAPATIRRMETAEVGLKIPYVQLLLKAYGVSDAEAEAFVELAEEANRPGWWQRFHDVLPDWFSMYVSLEGAASLLRMYEPHFVPGLLQTEEYARAVLKSGAAYLPIDPALPAARVDFMLTDSAPIAAVTTAALVERFDGHQLRIVDGSDIGDPAVAAQP